MKQSDAEWQTQNRRARHECSACWSRFGIAGQAFTHFVCKNCGDERSHPNTAIPVYCSTCSRDENRCCRCWKEMD